MPQFIVETILCKKSSCNFNVGGINEIVTHKKNGYIARKINPISLANAISYCLSSINKKYLTVSENKLRKMFNEKKIEIEYKKLINEIIKKMKVKFTNLYKLIHNKEKILNKIQNLIKNSRFSGGDEVSKFENSFKKFVGAKYCVSVGNGTDALEIAIKSLNLKKNSEIIIPVNTWIATAEAVVNNGYKIKFCDVNLDDYSMCMDDLKSKINKNTSAIIPVHLYGIATNVKEIKKIINKKKIKIIEDCAQGHGTKLGKTHVGTIGNIGTFVFFQEKTLVHLVTVGQLLQIQENILFMH